jgi:hypothetical protein
MRKWVCAGAMGMLLGGGVRLEARPWKKAVTAAMVLAVLGSGRPHPPAGGVGAPLGMGPFHPLALHGAGGLPAGLALDAAEAEAPGPDPADAALGACGDNCGTQFNLDLIQCEVFQRMPALRNYCLSRALATVEVCALGCPDP